MRTSYAIVVCAALLVGCSGDDDPVAAPSERPSATRSVAPAATPSRSASPSPTTSPPPKPVPMTTEGAYLSATGGSHVVTADPQYGCVDAYPGMLDVSCDEIALDGGTVLWIAGTEAEPDGRRRRVLRLHTFDAGAGGYVLRFVARDRSGGWTGFQIGPARLTGHGVDALVVQTTLAGDGASYDVLTWRSGGPLVLRAHRRPARQLRVVARENRLDDYQVSDNPRLFIYRRLTWDGARMVIADYGTVPAAQVPPPA